MKTTKKTKAKAKAIPARVLRWRMELNKADDYLVELHAKKVRLEQLIRQQRKRMEVIKARLNVHASNVRKGGK